MGRERGDRHEQEKGQEDRKQVGEDDTGVDLDKLIEVGRMAEEIVGHQLPGELIHAGSLDAFRRMAA